MQLWKGRFKKELSKTTNDFNSSISFDSRMYKEDIEGSIAHATMLGRCGIIKEEEANDIVKGLKGILADIENGNYLAHGELRLTEFSDTFLEQYFKKVEAVFGYGSEPQLDKVIHNGKGDATVVFSSVKDGKRVNHNASWALTDIKDDFNKTVLIPRSMFKSYNGYNAKT